MPLSRNSSSSSLVKQFDGYSTDYLTGYLICFLYLMSPSTLQLLLDPSVSLIFSAHLWHFLLHVLLCLFNFCLFLYL